MMAQTLPETGISGVYEVMVGVKDATFAIKYFGEFGFRVIDSVDMSEADALKLYGVKSKLKSYGVEEKIYVRNREEEIQYKAEKRGNII